MNNEILKKYSEDEKLKAAYALNMCTVSISQIIDYNDEYILEQEYEAILNNLNLKNIPKDEALLRILTEILNTVTFFRIQSLKKEQIEKQYKDTIKNAIWSAIPSVSMFVSGNPITMALSIATTIGTGYMNYRKSKNSALLEKEKEEMELQITAIEQLNALRRELFTTSWRLAEEYDFDDCLRLTEKQIKQYNSILMDPDEFRKYARLESIKSKFTAYPPFWYYYGHTASYIAQTVEDNETKIYYLGKAKEHFSQYEKLNTFNILREDQMTCSFALEYIDLLFLDDNINLSKIKELISIAIDKAGNNNDILQLCAMSCLRINDREKAAEILKILVNEGYNAVINAQLLSGLYVNDRNRPEYNILKSRVSPRYLFPMPEIDECNTEELNKQFEIQQKSLLKEKFKYTLRSIIDKYTLEINKKISDFDVEQSFDLTFFENSKKSERIRYEMARSLFLDSEKSRLYLERLKFVNLPNEYINVLQKMFEGIFSVNCYNNSILKEKVITTVRQSILDEKNRVNSIQEKIDFGTFGLREYDQTQKFGLMGFVKKAFEILFQYIIQQIDVTELNNLTMLEGNLMKLCNTFGIQEPEISIDADMTDNLDFNQDIIIFDVGLFGTSAIISQKNSDYIKEMLKFLKEEMQKSNFDSAEIKIIYNDQPEFESYFSNKIFENYFSLKPNSLMVLKDISKKQFDLIFTTEGIVYVKNNKVRTKTPYADVKFDKDALDLLGKKYRNECVDVGTLYRISREFNKKFINNLEQKIEYYNGILTAEIANTWFKNSKEAMLEDVTRVYAWAEQSLVNSIGFFIEREFSKENFLLQFYFANESGDILGLRIIEFEKIEPTFKAAIDKSGILKV